MQEHRYDLLLVRRLDLRGPDRCLIGQMAQADGGQRAGDQEGQHQP